MFIVREEAPEITRRIKRILMERIEDKEPPNRIWLSDAVYCGRKKIFRIVRGDTEHFDERTLNRLWLGTIVEANLEALGVASNIKVEYRTRSGNIVYGKIDVISDTREPIEVKATSSIRTAKSLYAERHIEQLATYCVAVKSDTGILVYYVPDVKITSLPVYRYRFDIEQYKSIIDERIDILYRALDYMEPMIAPPTWHSKTLDNWECKQCRYLQICAGNTTIT